MTLESRADPGSGANLSERAEDKGLSEAGFTSAACTRVSTATW